MVSVRFSDEEEAALRRTAEEKGESVSQVVRDAVLSHVMPGRSAIGDWRATTATATVGVALEYLEGGRLVPRSMPENLSNLTNQ
jgi:hypothetical protein